MFPKYYILIRNPLVNLRLSRGVGKNFPRGGGGGGEGVHWHNSMPNHNANRIDHAKQLLPNGSSRISNQALPNGFRQVPLDGKWVQEGKIVG